MADTTFRLGIANQLNVPDLSDLKIRCADREWLVHKLVLCTQSTYFDRAVKSGMKESHDGVIDLQEDDPDIVDHMLRWFYTGDYQSKDKDALKPTHLSKPEIHVLLFELADKYLLDAFKMLVVGRFYSLLQPCGNGAFVKAMTYVYKMDRTLSGPLRYAILTHVMDNKEAEFGGSGSHNFIRMMRNSSIDFAVDVAVKLAGYE